MSTVPELLQAREILRDVAEEERAGLSNIEVGVMIEVPSAALDAHRFAAPDRGSRS